MALLNRFMIKSHIAAAGTTSLTLEPDTGKSILVKDILTCPHADTYLNVKISKTQVGYFRIDNADLGSHLSDIIAPLTAALTLDPPHRKTILAQMSDAGVFLGYPIAEGEKMVLTHSDGGDLGNTQVVYEEYEAGDITSDMQNGTEATEYVYINYGRHSTAPAAAGSFIYDDQQTPVEFPEFPYGKVVPANKEIEINALLASDRGIGGAALTGLSTTYYALKKGRETLFDEDLNGILAIGENVTAADTVYAELGVSILGEASHLYRRPAMFFADPIHFDSGEELNVYGTYVASDGGAAAISLVQSEIGVIQTVRELS